MRPDLIAFNYNISNPELLDQEIKKSLSIQGINQEYFKFKVLAPLDAVIKDRLFKTNFNSKNKDSYLIELQKHELSLNKYFKNVLAKVKYMG